MMSRLSSSTLMVYLPEQQMRLSRFPSTSRAGRP